MRWIIWFIGKNNLGRVVDVVQVFVENQRRRGREPMCQFLCTWSLERATISKETNLRGYTTSYLDQNTVAHTL
jgi:hypothetical protein